MTIPEEIAKIEGEEKRLYLSSFTNAEAIEIGLTILELARERTLPVAIDIRRGDQQLFHVALAGTTPDNDDWARRKSNTVRRTHKSSLRVGLELSEQKTTLTDRQGLPMIDYATHGGSFPIHVDRVGFVGTVTVSGLPQRDDHALVVEGIETFLRTRTG